MKLNLRLTVARISIWWIIFGSFKVEDSIAKRQTNEQRSIHSKRESRADVILNYDTHRYLPSFQTQSETFDGIQYEETPDDNKEVEEQPTSGEVETKEQLAWLMKQKYSEFRRNLETSLNAKSKSSTGSSLPSQIIVSEPKLDQLNWLKSLIPASKSKPLTLSMLKQLRSADESLPSFRKGGLASLSLPVSQSALNVGSEASSLTSPSEVILDQRLGPSVKPTFDPSIVIDFLGLLRLNQRSQRFQDLTSSSERSGHEPESDATVVTLAEKFSPNFSSPRRRESIRDFRTLRNDLAQNTNEDQKFSSQKISPKILKRAKLIEVPSETSVINDTQGMAIYVSMMNDSSTGFGTKENVPQKSEFGPFSQGNDPNAGIHPSEITIPNVDVSELRLPQGVRDSLSKYLKPLIATLKPLRKSVPGLPGLDYPILSVVPYTNFYCNNMPWPGFYADTEARCQTWHACDIDGRQSTFLCPNGTIFNQALMVCDWWYNVECLSAPFLYPINERLFANVSKLQDAIKPYTRITPELLDTIFV